MWDQGRNCGRCVKVTCTDPKCMGKPDVIAYIVDMCPTCSNGDLDFATSPWSDLSGLTPGRVQISWNFTSCHNYITDTIKVRKKYCRKYKEFYFSVLPPFFAVFEDPD
jgi:expansin (peptidoglycan-binding protein)